jgi:glycosyltransferase involved in cell wall biosynthesis
VKLVVEGWRSSSHSYALVNQHQLLHLLDDPRFEISHADVPFYQRHWAQLEAGFAPEARARLQALPPPPAERADAIYRIAWPLRVHPGRAERVFLFGTCELGRFPPGSFCGPDGTASAVEPRSVEIVTPSRWSREGFLRSGFEERHVHVIPHGIEPAEFLRRVPDERQQLRAALGIRPDALVFLTVGAMTWNKGIGPLLGAFTQFRLREERAVLVLKGGDSLYGNLMNAAIQEAAQRFPAIANPQVVNSIRYVSQNLTRGELASLYRMSDAYVSPYRAEGFNIPVLEALATGLPVIVTRGGATDDFCPDHLALRVEAIAMSNSLGSYLEPRVESIIACMEEVARSTAVAELASREGPRWAAEHYSWRAIARRLGDLIAGT